MSAIMPMNDQETEFKRIKHYASGQPNDEIYATMLSSWQQGEGEICSNFGLGETEFVQLLSTHFPGLDVSTLRKPERMADTEREDELDDVYRLLASHQAGLWSSEIWMAKIVAIACQGHNHLWQDLGLWSRQQLSDLLAQNFPSLAEKNVKNMKWKKFFYKQLCITEGIYTCRAPSCEVCTDYDNCFGPEE